MNNQNLTDDQRIFLEKVQAHRKEKVEGLAYSALALSLKADLPVFDLPYYVLQRARQLIEEGFKTVDFSDPEIIAARKAFMKVCLKKLVENIPAPEVKEEVDETDARDNRCEPVVQELVRLLLAEDIIFSDEEYFDLVLANEESVPLSAAIAGYESALDEKMSMIISEHWRRASDNLWGVDKEKVTFSMLDTVLKQKS